MIDFPSFEEFKAQIADAAHYMQISIPSAAWWVIWDVLRMLHTRIERLEER